MPIVQWGWDALTSNTSGNDNTALGNSALSNNFTGNDNTALGYAAGNNLTTGDNNIDIGWSVVGVAGESNTTRIGNGNITATYVSGISGATVANGAAVLVGSNGHLGTINSSVRFKDDIMPMDRASEAILSFKPVTFRYKKEIDRDRTPQFGLVAEDVEKVNADLVLKDAEGKVYTVRYDAVNAMLLNEFLKEHRKVEEQGRKVEAQDREVQQQETIIAKQQKQIDALTAGLQKVSAQLEVSKAAPQTVLNRQ
jgi:hypothetical protein